MGRTDKYVTIEARLMAKTAKGALLKRASDADGGGWVPRSCLHFSADKAIDDAALGDTLEIRVMEWIAEEKDLL